MQPAKKRRINFSDQYREDVFWLWYNDGCPPLHDLSTELPVHRKTRPTYNTIRIWYEKYAWKKRAEALDNQVVEDLERNAIESRVEMLSRHAEVGLKMIEKGLAFLESKDGGITEQRSAINAIKVGAAIETVSRGIPDALLKTGKMSDKQILNIIRQLGDGISPKELPDFDVEVIPTEVDTDGSAET